MSISHFISTSSIWQQHGGTIAVFTFWAIVGIVLMIVGYATKATFRGARNWLLTYDLLFFSRRQPLSASQGLKSGNDSLQSSEVAPMAGYVIGSVALNDCQIASNSSVDDFFAMNMKNTSKRVLNRLVGNDVIAAATS